MRDLNSLIDLPSNAVFTEASPINNVGEVVASASVAVIPEPESYALLLAGLALTGFMARRKKAQNPAGHC